MKKQYFTFFTCLLLLTTQAYGLNTKKTLIIIDPAGHAGDPGRSLTYSYERKETYEFATALKNHLEKHSSITVIMSRKTGDHRQPLQNTAFANKLNIDYFMRLHLHKGEQQKPKLYAFRLVFDPVIDFARRIHNSLAFIPIHQAHYQKIHTTNDWCQAIKKNLSNDLYQKIFDFHGPLGIPVKSLVGITAPALIFEASIANDSDWKQLVEPIGESVIQSLES